MRNTHPLSVKIFALLLILAVTAACAPTPAAVPTTAPVEEPTSAPVAEPTPVAADSCTEPFVVDVIYHPTIGGTTALAIADAYGMFEEECLELRYQRFTAGPPEIAAMVAGRADIGFIGSGAAWLAFRGDVNIIALDNIAMTDEIVAKKSSGINTLEDLKGKTIGAQVGAAGDSLLSLALAKAGLTREDVTIINIDNNNLAAAILSTGTDSVDAIAGWQPGTTAIMTALGDDAIKLATNKDFPEASFPSTWVANKDFVQKNPEIVQRFVNALTKAQAYRAENMQEASEWASQLSGQPANDLYSQIPFAIWPTGPELKAYYHDGSFAEMLQTLAQQQIAGGRITEAEAKPIDEVFIDTFAKNATADY